MLASVTCARPSCRPVRRDVLSTSGVLAQNLFHVRDHAVGLCQRRAGGHDVVHDEAAFVHRGQQVADPVCV